MVSPLTHEVLTPPVPPARRRKSPCSTSDAPSAELFVVMAVDSPAMAVSSSDVPRSDARPRPPLLRRKQRGRH